ncbi:MAG: DNA primase [Bacteroidetes bacterium]|nr:DNA primase [Bacteroidota bacterium]
MRIPEEKIQEIRLSTDAVEYIGQFVRLKKRGKDYTGLCPFHNEKTPSFTVSPSKQLFYCFGCHRGGDVVKFVMEYEKLSYVEALEHLAERNGIEITRTEELYQSAGEIEKLYNICTIAARHFYNNLKNTPEGDFAHQYFLNRGFSNRMIVTFGLGYSTRSWDGFLRYAEQQGIAPEHLEQAGFVKKRDDGTYYDTFRGRAMFPIFNTMGRVIAFGARKLYDDDSVPGKYINSPETPIYHKSKTLYGLSHAKDAIREKDFVVLVEGYADLISVVQAGIKNITASSGTALTQEQIQLISRYTKNITLVYDADSAGANAMMRGVDIILENGLDLRIVQLPAGDDPDSFVRKNGGRAFEELLKKAVTFIDFKANQYRQEGKFDSPEGKADAVRGLVQSISKIKDPLKRSFFIKEIAEKYSLYESTLFDELEKFTRKVPERFVKTAESVFPKSSTQETEPPVSLELPNDERELLSAVFEDPEEMIPFVFQLVQVEEFSHQHSRELAAQILEVFEETGALDTAAFISRLQNEQLKTLVTNITFNQYQLSERWNEIGSKPSDTRIYELAFGAVKGIKKRNLETLLHENRIQMKNASLNGEETISFLKTQQEILTKLKEVDEMKLTKE